MKFLHAAALLRPPSGIIHQMRWEYEAARELGIDWDVKLYCPKGWMELEGFVQESPKVKAGNPNKGKPMDWMRFRFEYHKWLMGQADDYDAFLLRYYVHDPFQMMFVLLCKKPVFFVHHTLEEPELRLAGNMSSKIRTILERMTSVPTLRAAAGLVGVTQEIVDYEMGRANSANLQNFVYPNGIKFTDQIVADKRGEVPELLFIASRFVPWHGLDLLLDSIERSDALFKLHLVGQVDGRNLDRAQHDSRIIVHGALSVEEIRSLAEFCWLGLSSFGLDRKRMTEACTLKVREYLMMGLPVYAGHHDVIEGEAKFLFFGPAEIDAIVSCAQENRVDRETVVMDSRRSTCKKQLLKSLYESLM